MRNSILVTFEKEKPNLIIEGIEDFIFLVEGAFKEANNFEQTYFNHAEFYKAYKERAYFVKNIKDKLKKDSRIELFNLEGPRNQLTSVIHIILELIADREFSCNFAKYSMDDIREMQNALSILWGIGETKNPHKETIKF